MCMVWRTWEKICSTGRSILRRALSSEVPMPRTESAASMAAERAWSPGSAVSSDLWLATGADGNSHCPLSRPPSGRRTNNHEAEVMASPAQRCSASTASRSSLRAFLGAGSGSSLCTAVAQASAAASEAPRRPCLLIAATAASSTPSRKAAAPSPHTPQPSTPRPAEPRAAASMGASRRAACARAASAPMAVERYMPRSGSRESRPVPSGAQ
mmetsp:Transcript_19159/g.62590  ORF Transcript_19159/g.62590 Transcript_19159/m.62590 type:complete len:212 (-) Transcript_19159:928-1563(-)